jgi:ribA/ribD-fused uncharacterized protein
MRPFSIAVPLFGIPLVRVSSVEHYFQAMKVFYLLSPHGEDQLALFQEILSANRPHGAKALGRALPLNSTLWDLAALGHMLEGMIAKFHQHSDLREELMVTDGRDLVEHSRDRIWGDGLGGGRNYAGQALMLARELFINGPA